MRDVGIAIAWLTIGVGVGLLLRAVLFVGRPRREDDDPV